MGEAKVHVLFLTPYKNAHRGNATTAWRITKELKNIDVDVDVFGFEEEHVSIFHEKVKKADIIHGLHIRRTMEWKQKNHLSWQCPYILTSGGTDINIDMSDEFAKKKMEGFLATCCALSVFTDDAYQKTTSVYPFMKEKTHIIPQGISSVQSQFKGSAQLDSVPNGYPNLLLPAGLRPVKDVLYVMESLLELRKMYPDLQFVIIGEVIDEKVYEDVLKCVDKYDWFNFLSPVAYEEMGTVYDWADVVINTSISEGQPMTVLEAMARRIPVMARSNPGNASVIKHKKNGCLFSTPEEFKVELRQILSSSEFSSKMVDNAQQHIFNHHHPKTEAEAYLQLYKHCLNHKL